MFACYVQKQSDSFPAYSYNDPEAVVGCEDGTARLFDMYSRKCSQIIRYGVKKFKNWNVLLFPCYVKQKGEGGEGTNVKSLVYNNTERYIYNLGLKFG